MTDVERYIEKRKKRRRRFAKNFESGFEAFAFSVILRQARERAGITQEMIAKRLRTKKSAISRIENHAEDIRLSTLEKYANALGKRIQFASDNAPRAKSGAGNHMGMSEDLSGEIKPDETIEIVGIVPATRHALFEKDPSGAIYLPFAQGFQSNVWSNHIALHYTRKARRGWDGSSLQSFRHEA